MKKIFAVLFFVLGIGAIGILMMLKQDGRLTIVNNGGSILQNVGELSGQVSELVKDADSDTVGEVISFVKEKASEGSLSSKEGIKEAISQGEEKFNVEVPADTSDKIADTVSTLEDMGFSTEILVEKVEETYKKYGEDFTDHLEEAFVEAAGNMAEETAQNTWDSVKNSLQELLKK